MNDQYDESSPAEDIEHIGELMEAEREKEITQATTMQGQIVALIMVLREKGLFTQEDVDKWEHTAETVQAFMVEIMNAQQELEEAEATDDEIDGYRAASRALDLSIRFSKMLGRTDEDLAQQIAQRDEFLEKWMAGMEAAKERRDDDQLVTPD